MQYGKTLFISLAASAAVMMSGCGDATSTDTPAAAPAAVLKVERGPILDANVTDANGTQARELGNGEYAFDEAPQYPVTAVGGYIDINRNGRIDAGEVKNTLKLEAENGDVVTIATSLAADENVSAMLEESFGLTPEEIATKTPGEDEAIEALSNVVYAYAMEHNISDLSELNATELAALQSAYRETVQTYENDAEDAAEHEETLVQQLQLPTLDDAEAEAAQQQLEDKLTETVQAEVENHDLNETPDGTDALEEQFESATQQTEESMEGIEDYSSSVAAEVGGDSSSVASQVQDQVEETFEETEAYTYTEQEEHSESSASSVAAEAEDSAQSEAADASESSSSVSSSLPSVVTSAF